MSKRELAILEAYPSGELWTHYFHDEDTARWNLAALREAHPAREYVAVGFEEEAVTAMRCVVSHDGYGCTLGADHDGDTHEGADGHTWTTNESWGYEEADD